ncbi:MAG: hypothetical protein JWM37_290 [Candidatus Saccharibacteria bacterium]|nr:hypothetical protein [Candidatus Saccharibacteria bacterium]
MDEKPSETDSTNVTPSEPTKVVVKTADNATPETPGNSEYSPTVTSSPPTKSKKKLLLAILCLIALIVVAAVVWFLFLKHSDTKSANSGVVKKDIPHLVYATNEQGWADFYPTNENTSSSWEANVMFFESLVRYKNKTQIVPSLATGWTNPDSSTWVFNLKSGVKFHSGRTMTAQDVKASFEGALDSPSGELYATTLKSIEATGPLQVTIKTTGPDPTLLNKLAFYFVYDTKSGKQSDPINGTGPFIVKPGTTPADNSLEMTAFDQYHGGHVYVRSVSFTTTGDGQLNHGKLYGDGKADLQYLTADKPTAVGSRQYNTISIPQLSVSMIALNSVKAGSPLQNLKARQALEYAIDPVAVAKSRGIDNAIAASQLVAKGIPGYDPAVVRPTLDLAKAKSLLQEAGYAKGFAFTLTYYAPQQKAAESVKQQLAQINVTANLDPQTDTSALGAKAFGGKTDSFLITWSSDLLDASDVLGAFLNTPNYANKTAQDFLDKAQSASDSSSRLSLLKQASRTMAEDVAVVPLYVPNSDTIIYNPSYVIARDVENNTLGVYFQDVYAK